MARQLIGPTKALGATRKLASVWLFSSVRSDVSRLMFEAMEGLITERTFVRAGQITSVLIAHVYVDSSHRRHV